MGKITIFLFILFCALNRGSCFSKDKKPSELLLDDILSSLKPQLNPSLKMMSFFGYSPKEFLGWANVGFTNDTTVIREGGYSFTQLYNVESVFFLPNNGVLELRDDYVESWSSVEKIVEPLYKSNFLSGFFM